jgi:hypothetical protein
VNDTAALALAKQLAPAVGLLELALSNGGDPRSFEVMALRKKASVLAADLQSAINAPVKIKPWTSWTQGNAE